MKCKCGEEMSQAWAIPDQYELYFCDYCGQEYDPQNDVWDDSECRYFEDPNKPL